MVYREHRLRFHGKVVKINRIWESIHSFFTLNCMRRNLLSGIFPISCKESQEVKVRSEPRGSSNKVYPTLNPNFIMKLRHKNFPKPENSQKIYVEFEVYTTFFKKCLGNKGHSRKKYSPMRKAFLVIVFTLTWSPEPWVTYKSPSPTWMLQEKYLLLPPWHRSSPVSLQTENNLLMNRPYTTVTNRATVSLY
jgi:hypothetical protein